MLQSLKIQNYALIENLEIDFNKGFSTITGETGAGKSIILGALSLLVGQRADTSVLKNAELKSIVEANFIIEGYNLEEFLENNDIDYEPSAVIRREIMPNGKTRAFINDTPVNLDVLKDLGERLIDIHSQHQNMLLNSNEFQLSVVDSAAGVKREVDEYNEAFARMKKLQTELSSIKRKAEEANKELDYKKFLFDELDKFKLRVGEQEDLLLELEKLTHVEDLRDTFSLANTAFNQEEISILDQLRNVGNAFQRTQKFHKSSGEIAGRIETCYIELKDISSIVTELYSNIEADPDRLQQVNSRLDMMYNLQQKHHVKSVSELVAIREELKSFIGITASFDDSIKSLEDEILALVNELEERSEMLFEKRIQAAEPLSARIEELLRNLGMPNVLFSIRVSKTSELRLNGSTQAVFMFSANKNSALQPITDVASGGELSRIMLCLKAEMSGARALPTIVFDEIDTGVSGDIAAKMGNIMQQMSLNMQVICITHLPQIASKGAEHYVVYKNDLDHTTVTNIKKLSGDERVTEIAKMLSGQNLTEAAIQNAKELLSS